MTLTCRQLLVSRTVDLPMLFLLISYQADVN